MSSKLLILCLTLLLGACSANTQRMKFAADNYQHKNYPRTLRYLEPSAKAGDPDAQYAIGYMYFKGQGVVESRSEAVKWFQLAAAKGQPDAMTALKMIHQQERRDRYS